jgi:sec-independent protein translocase protein TatA
MFGSIGLLELVLVLLVILLLFGTGRVGKIGREMGSAIGEMKKGLKESIEPANVVEGTKDS